MVASSRQRHAQPWVWPFAVCGFLVALPAVVIVPLPTLTVAVVLGAVGLCYRQTRRGVRFLALACGLLGPVALYVGLFLSQR